jgi:hypothetical protein
VFAGEFLAMFQDQLLDLKKVQGWLASRGDEAWEWGGAASSLLQVRGAERAAAAVR